MPIIKVKPAPVTPKVANAIVKIAGNAASTIKVVTSNVASGNTKPMVVTANLKLVANIIKASNVTLGITVKPAPVTPKVANAIVKIAGNIAANVKVVTANVTTGKPTVSPANLKIVASALTAAKKPLGMTIKKK